MEAMEGLAASPSTGRAEQSAQSPSDTAKWNPVTRVGFRFFFAYFALYNFPFPLSQIPGSDKLFNKYTEMWHALEVWTGKHVLHLSYPITVFANGSGDTTSDYVQVFCFLILVAGA